MTILSYHGFNDWQPRKENGEDLNKSFTFGFELEVTSNRRNNVCSTSRLSEMINQKFGSLFVCERDGSIGNGVEIISQPMTWKWYCSHKDIFKDLLALCDENGFDSHKGDLCGLHVHVGRKALGGIDLNGNQMDEKKTVININFIMERFQNELFKFSRRTTESYERWTSPRTDLYSLENGNLFIDKSLIKRYGHHEGDRYHSLNLSNANTVEIRLLRGTLKWETFDLSMNLIHNVVEQSRISNNSVTFKTLILNGLDESMRSYALSYCETRGIDLDSKECNTIIFLEKVHSNSVNNAFTINLQTLGNILDE